MKKVGSREFKNRQGYYLQCVRKGETLLITDRGKVIAKVEPVSGNPRGGFALDAKLRELAAQGHIRLGSGQFAPLKPVVARGKPASRIIIEDRR